jgi:multidrug efflux pump
MLSVSLMANTDLKNVDEFKQLVVAEKNGTIVRLSDVADVVLGAESYDEEVKFGGKTATFMGIWVLPTESTVEVIQRVRAAMPDIERSLPAGLKGQDRLRRQQIHRRRPQEIVKTLTETLLIVMVVIFLFMGSFALGPHPNRGDAAVARRRAWR